MHSTPKLRVRSATSVPGAKLAARNAVNAAVVVMVDVTADVVVAIAVPVVIADTQLDARIRASDENTQSMPGVLV